jgi:hypothetical protein
LVPLAVHPCLQFFFPKSDFRFSVDGLHFLSGRGFPVAAGCLRAVVFLPPVGTHIALLSGTCVAPVVLQLPARRAAPRRHRRSAVFPFAAHTSSAPFISVGSSCLQADCLIHFGYRLIISVLLVSSCRYRSSLWPFFFGLQSQGRPGFATAFYLIFCELLQGEIGIVIESSDQKI